MGNRAKIGSQRYSWEFFLFQYVEIEVETGEGDLFLTVSAFTRQVSECRFHRRDNTGIVLPLWLAFPEYDAVRAFWRQGVGENYKYDWHGFWRNDEVAEQSARRGNIVDAMLNRV